MEARTHTHKPRDNTHTQTQRHRSSKLVNRQTNSQTQRDRQVEARTHTQTTTSQPFQNINIPQAPRKVCLSVYYFCVSGRHEQGFRNINGVELLEHWVPLTTSLGTANIRLQWVDFFVSKIIETNVKQFGYNEYQYISVALWLTHTQRSTRRTQRRDSLELSSIHSLQHTYMHTHTHRDKDLWSCHRYIPYSTHTCTHTHRDKDLWSCHRYIPYSTHTCTHAHTGTRICGAVIDTFPAAHTYTHTRTQQQGTLELFSIHFLQHTQTEGSLNLL